MSEALGKRIKGLRKLKGWTQLSLAQNLGVSVSLLSNIERGRKEPTPSMLERLSQAMNVPGEELFFLPEKKEKEISPPGIDEVSKKDETSK